MYNLLSLDLGPLKALASTALSILVAVVVIILAIKLLGKLAKFVIILAVLGLIAWLFFSGNSIVANAFGIIGNVKDAVGGIFGK